MRTSSMAVTCQSESGVKKCCSGCFETLGPRAGHHSNTVFGSSQKMGCLEQATHSAGSIFTGRAVLPWGIPDQSVGLLVHRGSRFLVETISSKLKSIGLREHKLSALRCHQFFSHSLHTAVWRGPLLKRTCSRRLVVGIHSSCKNLCDMLDVTIGVVIKSFLHKGLDVFSDGK